ncbi:FAD synthase [Candidatus Uhrbacteria bacterium CG_4_10_14_0_8_um_filter_58_22]|uniref:FAD synthase n=1 Tax=Candidatus Uhrbacteria bacterium CG_4_10_14_0_8_um_filter_58_22 TaxID=1975029 RepID=A0A2M7QB62_9BACT|nr:MAG: hypothetical protein AUJ19_00125 [Parcubacteria group bacterium CG1_02_58_44]PIY62584.1 MAG: FAD synthase [Candidatus Uhrbacteria bacterium CG_4_10_14_0_8_um_filter_58_22]
MTSADIHFETPNVERPKTVLVFGVFDLLHPGHVFFLERAKRQGDRLIAVVCRDDRAESSKGRRPVLSLEERLKLVRALRSVDEAVPGDPPGEWSAIVRCRPDIICLGFDQSADHSEIRRQLHALSRIPKVVKLPRRDGEKLSSSVIRQRLLDRVEPPNVD